MEIKKKDIFLLTELFEDSSQSNRQIAKKIGISKETVSSRIQFLIKNEIIRGFSLKINYPLLKFENFDILIRVKNSDIKKIQEFMKFLYEHDNSVWIGRAFGKYDIKVTMYLKKIDEINLIIKEISDKFGENIDQIDSLYITSRFKPKFNLFLENLFEQKISRNNKKVKKVNSDNNNNKIILDPLNKKILYQLGQGKKKRLVDIAINLNITAEAVKYRIKRLEELNIITGHSITINGNKLGKIWCLVLMNIEPEKISIFKSYIQEQKFLSNYGESIGIFNIYVQFFANSIEKLYEDLNSIRSHFYKDIRNFEIMIFFEEIKYPKVPKCILEE